MEKAARSAINLARGVSAAAGFDAMSISADGSIEPAELRAAFDKIETAARASFAGEVEAKWKTLSAGSTDHIAASLSARRRRCWRISKAKVTG